MLRSSFYRSTAQVVPLDDLPPGAVPDTVTIREPVAGVRLPPPSKSSEMLSESAVVAVRPESQRPPSHFFPDAPSDSLQEQQWWQNQQRKDTGLLQAGFCIENPPNLLLSTTKISGEKLLSDAWSLCFGCLYATIIVPGLVLFNVTLIDAIIRYSSESCEEGWCNNRLVLCLVLLAILTAVEVFMVFITHGTLYASAGVPLLVCAKESIIREALNKDLGINSLLAQHLLMTAISNKNLKIVDLLLYNKIKVNFKYISPHEDFKPTQLFLKNLTPLEAAARVSSPEIVTHLLDVGANVTLKALDNAALAGDVAIMRQLLVKGDIKPEESTFIKALEKPVKTKVLKLLLASRYTETPLSPTILTAAARVSTDFLDLLGSYNLTRTNLDYITQLQKDCGLLEGRRLLTSSADSDKREAPRYSSHV
jgi:hypothetical protein